MDDRDAQVLRLLAELFLGVLGDEIHRHQAELIAARLRTEDIFEILVGQHRRGNAGGDPHELLQLLDAGGHRHALRRREEAEQHVDLFLLDEADRLVDGDVGLALRVGIDRLDLVAFDAGLAEMVEHDLGAGVLQLGAAAGERAGQVVDHADLDFLFLGLGGNRHSQHRHRGRQPDKQARNLVPRHQILPVYGAMHLFVLSLLSCRFLRITRVAPYDVKAITEATLSRHLLQARRPKNSQPQRNRCARSLNHRMLNIG